MKGWHVRSACNANKDADKACWPGLSHTYETPSTRGETSTAHVQPSQTPDTQRTQQSHRKAGAQTCQRGPAGPKATSEGEPA